MHSPRSLESIVHGPAWTPPAGAPETLPEVLDRAARLPGAGKIICRASDTGDFTTESYSELQATAERIASGLYERGVRPGDVVVLQLPESREFLAGWWGCIRGGFLPLPVSIPASYREPSAALEKLGTARQLTRCRAILTSSRLAGEVRHALHADGNAAPGDVISLEELRDAMGDATFPVAQPDDPALLVLTSGSTETPRVVILTHRNLVWTAAASVASLSLDVQDLNLNWMPLEHIGALAFHVRDVYAGCSQVHISTAHILEHHFRWLESLERFRATVCWAPNFAFGLFRTDGDAEAALGERCLDLSALRVLLNGSEPIVPATVHRFWIVSKAHGLRSDCMVPCWGMSETTAAVTFNQNFRLDVVAPDATGVETGTPLPGIAIRIVDREGRLVADGTTGHVQVHGPSVTPGYFGNTEATTESRTADGWWKTGDLGFLRQGQLTITGRQKSLIIIHGMNYSPAAIEAAAAGVPGLESQTVAACAVRSPSAETDELALFFTLEGDDADSCPAVLDQIRTRVAERCGVVPRHLVPIAPDRIPRTANGKVRHIELRRRFEAGEFGDGNSAMPRLTDEPAPGELHGLVLAAFQAALDRRDVGLDDNFFALGGDSLRAARLISRLRATCRIAISLPDLFVAGSARGVVECLRLKSQSNLAGTVQIPNRSDGLPPLPLSSAQQRLWLLAQVSPAHGSYHVSAAVDRGDPSQGAFELLGTLDVAALSKSLKTLVQRHEILRTTFAVVEGRPVQIVHDALAIPLETVDLRGESEADAEKQLIQEALEQLQPFDLQQGPLWRTKLLRLSETRHVLFFTLHHLLCDGWSVGNLRRELAACYGAWSTGQTPDLPPLAIQYGDYAVWQNGLRPSSEQPVQRNYWRRKLADLHPLKFPADRQATSASVSDASLPGGMRVLSCSKSLTLALEELSREADVTLYTVLLAAFKLLGVKYGAATDVAVGSPVANRSHPELEPLVGCFVNLLILRTDLSGDPSFRQLLGRARDTVFEAFSHQDFPFELLLEDLRSNPQLDFGRPFHALFAVHNFPLAPLALHGLEVRPRAFATQAVRYDVEWDVWRVEEGLKVNVFYRRDLFDEATVDRWLEHYRQILAAIVVDPDQRISTIPLSSVGDAVQRRPQRGLSHVAIPATVDSTDSIQSRFEARVCRRPDAIALSTAGGDWSYRTLNECANHLASELVQAGIGRETLVATCGDRTPEWIASLLGILKAGGAYLPLDPAHPDEHLARLVQESGVTLLLTERQWSPRLSALLTGMNANAPPQTAVRLVCMEDLLEGLPGEDQNTDPRFARSTGCTTAHTLACVMYTSGTTGAPKGVEVLHRGIIRLVCDANYIDITPDDTFVQLASPAFDASTFEIWGALLNGARLVLPPAGPSAFTDLGTLLQAQRITILWLTAGLFHHLVRQIPHELRRLRFLLAGGDVLSPEMVAEFFAQAGPAELINGYGPTENTTFTCCHRMRAAAKDGRGVPIGVPIPETEVFVLDANLQPVPAGVVGELFIGGGGLGRGYRDRPAETAERFLPHPWSRLPGARLYRSGDLVRMRSDGVLEFAGRCDRQLKIRGYRVEPAEIEAVLRQHPLVRQAVVFANAPGSGEKRLVAYAATDMPGKEEELTAHLRRKLPDALVPQALITVRELPLDSRGKLDWRALPKPEDQPARSTYVAPQAGTEQVLSEILAEALRIPRVGRHDHFFHLGGDSLLGMQVMSRIFDRLQVRMPLRQLFEAPTIAELTPLLVETAAQQSDPRQLARLLADVEQNHSNETAVESSVPDA